MDEVEHLVKHFEASFESLSHHNLMTGLFPNILGEDSAGNIVFLWYRFQDNLDVDHLQSIKSDETKMVQPNHLKHLLQTHNVDLQELQELCHTKTPSKIF